MFEKELIKTYRELSRDEKGKFVSCLVLLVGGTPFTWYNRFNGRTEMKFTPAVQKLIENFISSKAWLRKVSFDN